jgi:hypothetical protein
MSVSHVFFFFFFGRMEAPNDATLNLEAKLAELEGDIKRVEQEIIEVGRQLKPLEEKPLKERDQDEKDEIRQLRKKEELLRKEKEQLRDEKNKLLENTVRTDNVVLKKLEELSLKVDATSQKVDATSQKVDALRKPEVSESPAQVGKNILNIFVPNVACSVTYGSDAVFSEAESISLKSLKPESELVRFLMPKLALLIPPESMQQLVNSEKYGWVETGGDQTFFRKPDLFLVASCFWAQKGSSYDAGACGVLASWKLRDSVSVLLEAKLSAVNEVIGQLVQGMQFLCLNDGGMPLERYGVALLRDEFYVIQFAGPSVVEIEKCGWSEAGGLGLLRKALSHTTFWSQAVSSVCRNLNLTAVSNGTAFLGMGAFGRVFKCYDANNSVVALKVVICEEASLLTLGREYLSLQSACKDVSDCVIQVHQQTVPTRVAGFWFSGYSMELGELVQDFSSPKVRREIFQRLCNLHCHGWCHGDPRTANIVKVGRAFKWVDFRDACQFGERDGKFMAEKDMQQLIRSIYARVQGVHSPDVKLPKPVMDHLTAYSSCFSVNGDRTRANDCLNSLFEECENVLKSRLN